MNKAQWYVLGIGLFLFGMFLTTFADSCLYVSDSLLTACYVRRYALSVPGLLSIALGVLFTICAWFEPFKKKK